MKETMKKGKDETDRAKCLKQSNFTDRSLLFILGFII